VAGAVSTAGMTWGGTSPEDIAVEVVGLGVFQGGCVGGDISSLEWAVCQGTVFGTASI
jgi:hypothetical protein